MKWIKSQRLFESEQVYLPTHEELENLPVFKEMKRVFHDLDVKWTTGERAYANGTRVLRISSTMSWAFYPHKMSIVRVEGGGTRTSDQYYYNLEGWEYALIKVFASALGEYAPIVAQNLDLRIEPEVLAKVLKTKKTENLNKFIAMYPGTPPEVLMTMFKKDDAVLDDRLARNPNSPLSLVEDLLKRANDRSSSAYHSTIISSLATNLGLSEDVYRRVFKAAEADDHRLVYSIMLRNPSVPVDVRDTLMTMPLSRGYWQQRIAEIRREIASTAKLSPDTLVELASNSSDPELAKEARKNPNMPDPTEWALKDW